MNEDQSQQQPQKPVEETIPAGRDERMWAMLSHISSFAMFIFPFGNIIAPLVIWLLKREQMPLVEDQGREVLNFQISISIYGIISAILITIVIGIPLFFAVAIFAIVATIIGAIRANDGERYRYPLNLRLIKS